MKKILIFLIVVFVLFLSFVCLATACAVPVTKCRNCPNVESCGGGGTA